MLKLKKIQVKKRENEKGLDIYDEGHYRPTLNVSEKHIPEIKDWKVGEKYQIVIEVEMKRMSSYENEDDKIKSDAGFDIVAYKVMGDYDDMSDEEFEELQGKALSS